MFLLISGRHVGAHTDGYQHGVAIQGVANGKIQDLPRPRDRCLKIRDRQLNDFGKSESETQCRENRARDLNYAKLRARDVRFVRSWSLETGSHLGK